MLRRLSELPLIVLLMGLVALSMWVPAAQGVVLRDHETARIFFYSGFILLVLTAMIAIATAGRRPRNPARANLVALAAAYAVLPLQMALPVAETLPALGWFGAWFEMVSSFTTTGLSLIGDPAAVPPTLHLWRAMAGWMGGFVFLVAAVAILAPMNLGGMEVISGRVPGRGTEGLGQITHTADPARRVMRHSLEILPVYGGLTLLLWVLLTLSGDSSQTALVLAMSTVSTSGITGAEAGAAGRLGEVLIFVVLLAALSRRFWPGATVTETRAPLRRDPELRLALALLVAVPAILMLRHWLAASGGAPIDALRALWGALFTTLSFLTTTGFVSADWETARLWSGLGTPGLVLAGLAIVGGGVATTAGGVKLLRVYALLRHGERELERLIHPNSIGGSGQSARRLRREGAYLAWVFFMLFALGIAAVVTLLTLVGMAFEPALILTLAALTTTGPLAAMAGPAAVDVAGAGMAAQAVLGVAMVVGRLEILAILALVAPETWRR
ncbi:MAG: hypothetical protein RIR62_943 [Pseudomonadota bacterium]|jgi:trk system potassium uptake protein TrkH